MRFALGIAIVALLGTPFSFSPSGLQASLASEEPEHAACVCGEQETPLGEEVAACACGCGGTPRPYCAHKGCVCTKAGAVNPKAHRMVAKGCKCGCGGTPRPYCAHKDCQCARGAAVDVTEVKALTAACDCGCGGTPRPYCAHKNCVCAQASAVDTRAVRRMTKGCKCGCGGTPRPSCAHKGCQCSKTEAIDTKWATEQMAGCQCGCGGTPRPSCAHKGCVCGKTESERPIAGRPGPKSGEPPEVPETLPETPPQAPPKGAEPVPERPSEPAPERLPAAPVPASCLQNEATSVVTLTELEDPDNHDHRFCQSLRTLKLKLSRRGDHLLIMPGPPLGSSLDCRMNWKDCTGSCEGKEPFLAGQQNVIVGIESLRLAPPGGPEAPVPNLANLPVLGRLFFKFSQGRPLIFNLTPTIVTEP